MILHCGPGWIGKMFPNSLFTPACQNHDEAYTKKKVSRKQADLYFFYDMDRLARTEKARFYHHTMKWAFYLKVRALGWWSYSFTPWVKSFF